MRLSGCLLWFIKFCWQDWWSTCRTAKKRPVLLFYVCTVEIKLDNIQSRIKKKKHRNSAFYGAISWFLKILSPKAAKGWSFVNLWKHGDPKYAVQLFYSLFSFIVLFELIFHNYVFGLHSPPNNSNLLFWLAYYSYQEYWKWVLSRMFLII